MKIKNLKIISISIAGFLLSSLMLVNAQAGPGNNRDNMVQPRVGQTEEKINQIQEKRNEIAQKKCEMVQNRIMNQLNRYEQNENRYQVFYNGISVKLKNLIEKLNVSYPEIDTTDLEGYMAKLETKIMDIFSNYQLYVSSLEESGNLVCGESDGQYRARIQMSREVIKQVKTDVQGLRTYYFEYIQPELAQIREQRKMMAGQNIEESETKDEDTNENEETEDNEDNEEINAETEELETNEETESLE